MGFMRGRKIIEIRFCFECPHSGWNQSYKNLECSKNDRKVIYDIESIPVWCPLPDVPLIEQPELQLVLY
jgi:hypothetical protein